MQPRKPFVTEPPAPACSFQPQISTSDLWGQNPATDPKDPLLGLALQVLLRHFGGFEPLALGERAGWFGLDECLI